MWLFAIMSMQFLSHNGSMFYNTRIFLKGNSGVNIRLFLPVSSFYREMEIILCSLAGDPQFNLDTNTCHINFLFWKRNGMISEFLLAILNTFPSNVSRFQKMLFFLLIFFYFLLNTWLSRMMRCKSKQFLRLKRHMHTRVLYIAVEHAAVL